MRARQIGTVSNINNKSDDVAKTGSNRKKEEILPSIEKAKEMTNKKKNNLKEKEKMFGCC